MDRLGEARVKLRSVESYKSSQEGKQRWHGWGPIPEEDGFKIYFGGRISKNWWS